MGWWQRHFGDSTRGRVGVVHPTGVRRDGSVGKPATLYALGRHTSALFSSAYAPLLSSVLTELGDRIPPRQLEAALRGAGRRLDPASSVGTTFDDRVRACAGLLGELGADADLVPTDEGYEIRGR